VPHGTDRSVPLRHVPCRVASGGNGTPPLELELIAAPASTGSGGRPPLLFLHGAFAGAWVWTEHFLPFFAAAGYPAYALSLRGHAGSDGIDKLVRYGIDDFVADVGAALSVIGAPAVLVGHSMGGLIAQRCLGVLDLRGLVLMASVPPEGLFTINIRLALSSPHLWTEMALAAVLHPTFADPQTMRRAMLSDTIPLHRLHDYYARMQNEATRATLEAQFPCVWRSAAAFRIPTLAVGAARDRLIPRDAVARTAWFHGSELREIADMAHAMMLEPHWQEAADLLLDWLRRKGF
jgi:pimeloyl-ACP methyl ester carboxylesterase